MARKKKAKKSKKLLVDPIYLLKQKESLKRNCRKTVFFNKQELAAINEYRKTINARSLSGLIRQVVMERVLDELDKHHPTLF